MPSRGPTRAALPPPAQPPTTRRARRGRSHRRAIYRDDLARRRPDGTGTDYRRNAPATRNDCGVRSKPAARSQNARSLAPCRGHLRATSRRGRGLPTPRDRLLRSPHQTVSTTAPTATPGEAGSPLAIGAPLVRSADEDARRIREQWHDPLRRPRRARVETRRQRPSRLPCATPRAATSCRPGPGASTAGRPRS